jgi:hypothetical protein
MCKENILAEINKQRKISENALRSIEELTKELEQIEDSDWDWISVKKASELMDLSIPSIYRLIDNKTLTQKIICGKKFVKKTEIKKI